MAAILAEFEGSKGAIHQIKLGHDGVTYCTCPGWRFSGKGGRVRTCKHLTTYGRFVADGLVDSNGQPLVRV